MRGITSVRWWTPDNMIYHFDDGDFANTECTMDETVLYLFAVNAMKKAGFRSRRRRTGPDGICLPQKAEASGPHPAGRAGT
jgi:hypothetical protein